MEVVLVGIYIGDVGMKRKHQDYDLVYEPESRTYRLLDFSKEKTNVGNQGVCIAWITKKDLLDIIFKFMDAYDFLHFET